MSWITFSALINKRMYNYYFVKLPDRFDTLETMIEIIMEAISVVMVSEAAFGVK